MRYYSRTAEQYDEWHCGGNGEHAMALSLLDALIKMYNITSVLDVGAGTGRTLCYVKSAHPHVAITGIEPSAELRKIAYRKGVATDDLVEGVLSLWSFIHRQIL